LTNTSAEASGRARVAFEKLSRIVLENRTDPADIAHGKKIFSAADWVVVGSILLYAVFAPHSIAVTQSACLLGLAAWLVQLFVSRKFSQQRTPVDVALLGFFACCVVSSFLSYDPLVSIKGLKSPAFFVAFYFVSTKVRTIKFARLLIFAMVGSCLLNVGATAQQLAAGRGLRIDSIREGSVFEEKGLRVGDVVLEVDGERVESYEDLVRIFDRGRGPLRLRYERSEALNEIVVSRQVLKEEAVNHQDPLGLATSKGRNFRVEGFYSHYETYAEVLQLIAALAIGILMCLSKRRSPQGYFLAIAILLITTALIFTATRAAFLGLAIATLAMAFATRGKRTIVVAFSVLVFAAPIAIYKLEASRGGAVLGTDEGSATYRLEVWREALGIIQNQPAVGIGKGSEAKLKDALGLYDNGRLPPGHFHSTLIQIGVWWGLPALIFYCSLMTIAIALALKLVNRLGRGQPETKGIALGALGAIIAFNVSSVAHFNFGDGEVVMAFWLISGVLFAVRRIVAEQADKSQGESTPGPTSTGRSGRNQHQPPAATVESSVQVVGAGQN
jgi:membrane-associated protease RseP (regulator of RpoE activity)